MATTVKKDKSGIKLPPPALINALPHGNIDEKVLPQELANGSDEMTAKMQQYVNQVASQEKKRVRKGKVDNRRSNETYASLPIAIKRKSMEDIAKILTAIPRFPGRSRPDFSKEDYIRNAVEKAIKADLKKLKNGGKISYSRSYNSVN